MAVDFEQVKMLFFASGFLIIVILGILILSLMGVNLPFYKIFFKKDDEKELKSRVFSIPPVKQPRILYKNGNFDETVTEIIVSGKDERTGLNKLRFKIGDRIAPFEVIDSPLTIRYVGSFVDLMTRDHLPMFEVVEGDIIDNLNSMKVSAELHSRSLVAENEMLKTSHKEIAKSYAEMYNSVKKGMYGVYGNSPQSSFGFTRPWFNRGMSSPLSGGEEGGMEEQV